MSSLSEWFQQLRSAHPSDLEARIARLEQEYEKLTQPGKKAKAEQAQAPTVIIEHVNIEHVHIDKLEHTNNFGALGIKELGGKLNIGVNYSGPIDGEELKNMFPAAKATATSTGEAQANGARSAPGQPTCNIRSKAL